MKINNLEICRALRSGPSAIKIAAAVNVAIVRNTVEAKIVQLLSTAKFISVAPFQYWSIEPKIDSRHGPNLAGHTEIKQQSQNRLVTFL